MKPRLYIFRKNEQETFNSRARTYFVVVSLDKGKKYPQNFVCVLPKPKSSIVKPSTEFSRVFGKDSPRVAKKLLRDALNYEYDAEIRAEIQERVALLGSDKAMGR